MNKNDTFPDSTDWDERCTMLISELRKKNVKKIALVGIRDYIFETFLARAFWKAGIATIIPEFRARDEIRECQSGEDLRAFWKAGIATIIPEFRARDEIRECQSGEDLRPFLTKYSKLGAEAVICENSEVHNAACECGICARMINLNK